MIIALRRLLREPLLQLLAIGFALFVVYDVRNRHADPGGRIDRIELTEDDLRQIGFAWVAQGRAPPSPDETRTLADARVREEILYREALALGLDKDDAIIRRRLAQKMEFLFEDVAKLREPSADELKRWFEKNAERFTLPGRVTFRHLYFSPDRRRDHTREDAAQALSQLADERMDSPRAIALGDPFMFQDYYGDRTPDDVAKTFGPEFSRAVFQITPGHWAGPIESGYGWHLVWVDSATPARVPSLEEVESDVKTAWTEEQRDEIREKAFAAMRARYEIVLPKDVPSIDVPAVAGIAPQ